MREDSSLHLRIRRAFTLLTAFAILLGVYNRYVLTAADPYHCSALLNKGQWLDPPLRRLSRPAFQKWQPPGCLLHEYNGEDVSACARGRTILFAGDSNVRQLFWATARKLNGRKANDEEKKADKHGEIAYSDRGVDLRFLWDPFLNGTALAMELQIYSENAGTGFAGGSKKRGKKEEDALMIVLGAGLWWARQMETAAAVRGFKESVDAITSYTRHNDGNGWRATSPFSGGEGTGDRVVLLPVEEPLYERLSPSRQESMMPAEVDAMNEYLRALSAEQGVTIPWVNQIMPAHRKSAYEQSGLHVVEALANRRTDVILNFRCNAKNDNILGSPYDRTCCSQYTSGNWFQWVLIVVALAGFPAAMVFLPRSTQTNVPLDVERLLPHLATLALALAYAFFADRSQLFAKLQKMYSGSELWTLAMLGIVVGLLTMRKKQSQNGQKVLPSKEQHTAPLTTELDPAFLSRSQTNEVRGFLAILVLLYNYTAAHTELPLYITLRLCIAGFLFTFGYGHTTYFVRTSDYSLHRIARVLLRLNLFPVLLAYQMYNNYLFYVFAPLVSFWFLILYSTLYLGSELNDRPTFLLSKIALSATLVTFTHTQAQPTDSISRLLHSLFGTNWNAGDWRDLVNRDTYIVYVGMLVALAHDWYRNTSAANNIKTNTLTNHHRPRQTQHVLATLVITHFDLLRKIALALALATCVIFPVLASRSPDQGDWNWWAPTISTLPILAYIVLRNAHSMLRSHYSPAMAWLGRCSLELYTLSFHVLRAADGKGVLSVGIWRTGDGTVRGDRWRDLVLLLPILLWVAGLVRNAVEEIVKIAFGEDVNDASVKRRVLGTVVGIWVLNLATS